MPEAVSVWGDVVDDLAVVALLSGQDPGGPALARELAGWRERLVAAPWVRERFLSHILRDVEIDGAGELARVVFIVNPRTLERVVRRLRREMAVR